MDVVREQYYRLNALLLSALGLWPYGTGNLRIAKRLTCLTLLLGCLITQLLTFVTVKYSTSLFLKNISLIMISMDLVLKYIGFCFYSNSVCSKLKQILEGIRADWSDLVDENEHRIIKKHAGKGRSYTKLFTMLAYIVATCMIICEFTPIVLDMIKPLNESRPLDLPVMTETYVTGRLKFYIFVVPFNIELLTTGTTFVATESLYTMFLQHAGALFEIVSYRLKTFDQLPEVSDCERTANMYLRRAVHMHARALDYTASLEMKFRPLTAIQYMSGVISLSTNLLRFSKALLITHDSDELLTSASIASGILIYQYYANYLSQSIADKASRIFDSTYQTRWYETPLSTQKLFLFILVKNTKPYTLNIFGNAGRSMQDFSRVLQMSWSYFMVLHSST